MNTFGLITIVIFMTNYCVMAQMTADKAAAECAKNVPQPEIDALVAGNFDKVTDKGKCYVDCFGKSMNFYTNNAVNEPVIVAFYTTVVPKKTPDDIKKAVNDCKGGEGAGCDKFFNIHKCIHMALNA